MPLNTNKVPTFNTSCLIYLCLLLVGHEGGHCRTLRWVTHALCAGQPVKSVKSMESVECVEGVKTAKYVNSIMA